MKYIFVSKTRRCMAAIMMIVSLILSVFAYPYICFADETEETEVNGDLLFGEEGTPRERTEDEIRLNNWKFYEMQQERKKNINDVRGLYPYSKTLSVPCFQQENGNYCGPASVKEVIQYKTGSSLSQSAYATQLQTNVYGPGTVKENVPVVLNSNLGSSVYTITNTNTLATWRYMVEHNININYPVVLDINTAGTSMPYSTTGHFLVVAGFLYDSTNTYIDSVYVADPHPTFYGLTWYPASVLWQANANHQQPAFIW